VDDEEDARMSIADVMTRDPMTLDVMNTAADAALVMAERDIGDVIVCDGDQVCGIVTDRDIVVRAVAHNRNPVTVTLGEICSRTMVTLSPDDSADDAVRLMSERALRRLPVVADGRAVGIVSLGDLAVERDRESVLGQISAAPPNT
jgi:CBS domain-containing protein